MILKSLPATDGLIRPTFTVAGEVFTLSKFGDWLFGPDTRNNPQHDHRWKTKSVTPVYDGWSECPVMHLYLLECEVCGDLKTHKHKG